MHLKNFSLLKDEKKNTIYVQHGKLVVLGNFSMNYFLNFQ